MGRSSLRAILLPSIRQPYPCSWPDGAHPLSNLVQRNIRPPPGLMRHPAITSQETQSLLMGRCSMKTLQPLGKPISSIGRRQVPLGLTAKCCDSPSLALNSPLFPVLALANKISLKFCAGNHDIACSTENRLNRRNDQEAALHRRPSSRRFFIHAVPEGDLGRQAQLPDLRA